MEINKLSNEEIKQLKKYIKQGLETNSTAEMYSCLEQLANIVGVKYRSR
jgi:hypothetical protein